MKKLEELTKEERIEYNDWVKTRPKIIRKLIKKYPPFTRYKIKKGAPYLHSCEGEIIEICSYNENGNIGVIVLAEFKTELGKENTMISCLTNFKDYDEMIKQDFKCNINPKWIIPIRSFKQRSNKI